MTAEQKGTAHVTLHLARLEELLAAPEIQAIEGRFEDRSGVERLLDQLRSQNTSRLSAINAKLLLDEMPGTGDRGKVDAALAAMAAYQQKRLSEQLATVRREGLHTLRKGMVFMVLCMAISAATVNATFLPELMRDLVSEGFVIAGWVALWHPMELLLYEWWPVRRDRKLYHLIADMAYTVEPAPRAAG